QTAVQIDLVGTGKDVGVGKFTINPAECNFGEVGVNVAAYCDLALGNEGNLEINITDVGYSPTNDQNIFHVAGAFPIPVSLPPGSAVTIRVEFVPTEPRAYEGGLYLVTTDPLHLHVDVPLHGSGGANPT